MNCCRNTSGGGPPEKNYLEEISRTLESMDSYKMKVAKYFMRRGYKYTDAIIKAEKVVKQEQTWLNGGNKDGK